MPKSDSTLTGSFKPASDTPPSHEAAATAGADVGAAVKPSPFPADQTRSFDDSLGPRSASPSAPRPTPNPIRVSPQSRDPDRYQIVAEHGRGGLGRVYRAHDKELGRDVALKELLEPTYSSEVRFFREALITARLEHPGIVPVHEAGRWHDGTPYYAMKLVAGRPLSKALAEADTFGQRLALLPHLIAVADAIAYAHDRSIIHRDLKPSNIILGEFGETIVIDWGLAKEMTLAPNISVSQQGGLDDSFDAASGLAPAAGGPFRTASEDRVTIAGSVLGTPSFMPPEQANGQDVDKRADVYALGAILYNLLAGAPPYCGKASDSTLAEVLAGPPTPADELQPSAPPELLAIVQKAMARDPADRYPNAGHIASDLNRYRAGQLVRAHDYSLVALAKRWLRRHRAAAFATVVVTTVIVIAFGRILAARGAAERHRALAIRERNDLILHQSATALDTDPTAAIAWLLEYPLDGERWGRLPSIAAAAATRGIARHVFHHPTRRIIMRLGFTFDDRSVISANTHRELRLWSLTPPSSQLVAKDLSTRYFFVPVPGGILFPTIDRSIKLYSLDSRQTTIIGTVPGTVAAMATTPNGQLTVLGDKTGNLVVIDLRALLPEIKVHESVTDQEIISLGVDLGGARIAVCDSAGRLRVLQSGEASRPILVAECHGAAFWPLPFSPNGHLLAVPQTGGDVAIWDLRYGSNVILKGHEEIVASMAFSADGSRLVTGGWDGTARIWDTAKGTELHRDTHKSRIYATEIVNESLVSADEAGELHMVDLSSGDVRAVFNGHHGTLFSPIAVAKSGAIASGDSNGEIRLWTAPPPLGAVLTKHSEGIHRIRVSADGRFLATASKDHTIRLLDRSTRQWKLLAGHSGEVADVKFAPSSDLLASAGLDGTVRLWSSNGDALRVLRGHKDHVREVAFSENGERLATASIDGTVRVWNLQGDLLGTRPGHSGGALRAEFMAGGAHIVTLEQDGMIRILDANTMAGVASARPEGGARVLALHPHRAIIALGTTLGETQLWDLEGRTIRKMGTQEGEISSIAFSPNGELIASASDLGALQVHWLLGNHTQQEVDARASYRSVEFSANSDYIACTTTTGTVRLWHLPSNTIGELQGHHGIVMDAEFDASSASLITAGIDGLARNWTLSEVAMVPRASAALRTWASSVTSTRVLDENEISTRYADMPPSVNRDPRHRFGELAR